MSRRHPHPRRGEGPLGLVIGLALLFVVGTALFKIVPLHIHGNEIYDVMNEQANFGGMKALDKIQYEIFRRAEEINIPLTLQDIKVQHRGPWIIIQANYQEKVDVFGYKYVYVFDKKVEKPVF
jgi:hypothetical protein